jgi:hypothetical protein
LNKNTKIWLNYIAGFSISLFLLWSIYGQIMKQLTSVDAMAWQQPGDSFYLYLCIGLMFVNTSLESYKWYLLSNYVEPVPYPKALTSYLAGVAFSIITPNRIGEYPGRILYLGRSNTFRYINVSVLGVVSQLWSVYLFGFIGLIYYNLAYPIYLAKAGLLFCIIVNVFIAIVYWRFEAWLPAMSRNRWLKRFAVYGKLLNGVTTRKQIKILSISILRFAIFTAQYLFLLRWMNVNMPPLQGFCMGVLFFWIMAVIPSIALTELGIRGAVGIYLFHHFSANTIGIIAATTGIWLLNLIVPSVLGSILIIRMRILR